MSDDEVPTWWDMPATKGEVVTSMIWTQALVAKLLGYASAVGSGSPQERLAALKEFRNEFDEYLAKIDEFYVEGGS